MNFAFACDFALPQDRIYEETIDGGVRRTDAETSRFFLRAIRALAGRSACVRLGFRLLGLVLLTLLMLPGLSAAQSSDTANSDADRKFFEALGRKIEPELRGVPERANQYVLFYQHELANDPRLFAFEISAHAIADGVRLEGYVEFEEHRRGVAGLLEALGLGPVDNQIRLLPDLTPGHRLGLVSATRTLSFDRMEASQGQSVGTECLLGEPLFLLTGSDDHYLTHAGEGYLGWVAKADVRVLDEAAFHDWTSANLATITNTIEASGGKILAAGTRLPIVASNDRICQLRLPDATVIEVAAAAVATMSNRDGSLERVMETGKHFLGTPYFWGGKSKEGVDCSGLVQLAYTSIGMHLPRDSNQQIYAGRLSGTRSCRVAMRAGDTMYFLGPRGRIRHTAMYLGDNQYLQAISPVVTISSLDPGDENFDAKRLALFAFAKRPLD